MLNRCNKRKSKEDYMRIALRGLRPFSRSIMKYALIYEAKWCEQIREEYVSFEFKWGVICWWNICDLILKVRY